MRSIGPCWVWAESNNIFVNTCIIYTLTDHNYIEVIALHNDCMFILPLMAPHDSSSPHQSEKMSKDQI